MAKVDATVEERVGMIERDGLRMPEMQRCCAWCSMRLRDVLD